MVLAEAAAAAAAAARQVKGTGRARGINHSPGWASDSPPATTTDGDDWPLFCRGPSEGRFATVEAPPADEF